MVDSLANMFGILMVVVVVLILLNLFGATTADHIPVASDVAGDAIHQLWGAVQRIVNYTPQH